MRIEPMFWLPEKLAPNVRCVLSLITDSEPHMALKRRKDFKIKDAEIVVPDLEHEKRLVRSKLSSQQNSFMEYIFIMTANEIRMHFSVF